MKHSRYAGVALLFASFVTAVAPVLSQGFLPDIPNFSDKIDRYENEIKAFEAKDKAKPVKVGETLFIGSSTFRLWPNLFGGSDGEKLTLSLMVFFTILCLSPQGSSIGALFFLWGGYTIEYSNNNAKRRCRYEAAWNDCSSI